MSGTAIDYADETWPVVTGCQMVSRGCSNCWAAKRAATRLKHRPAYEQLARRTEWGHYQWTGEVRLHPDKLPEPLHRRWPRVIFVAPLGDLFHDSVDVKFIAKVFGIMDLARQHTYLVLTKRPQHMAELMTDEDFQFHVGWSQSMAVRELGLLKPETVGPMPLSNVYLGTSVEDQEAADRRLPEMVKLAAQGWHTWISLEPQIGPVDLGDYLADMKPVDDSEALFGMDVRTPGIEGVVQGCESGPNARPFDLDWARDARGQCQADGVKYYLKQLPSVDGKRVVHSPELDGRTWLETPWSKT